MKTALITGASKGIGFALANKFLENGFTVIGTSTSGKIAIENRNFETLQLDLSDLKSIEAFEKQISKKGTAIDFLINNAGIGPDLDFMHPETVSFKQTFDVNVTGTAFLTESLIRHVNDGGKIINISSKMGSIDVCEGTDSVAYRMSKAALNMYTKILSNRLHRTNAVASVHPGWVRTTISKGNVNGRLSAEESASKIFDFAVGGFKTGIFWDIETQAECNW